MTQVASTFFSTRTCGQPRGILTVVLILICVAAFYIHKSNFKDSEIGNGQRLKQTNRKILRPNCEHDINLANPVLASSGVKVFEYNDYAKNKNSLPLLVNHTCVKYDIPSLSKTKKTHICTYHHSIDKVISLRLQVNGQWETANVEAMLKSLKMFPNIMVVDLGSNIGVFTVAAAAAGYEVISLDAFSPNHRLLQMSLERNDLTCRVTQIYNALYSKHTKIAINVPHVKIGRAEIGQATDKKNEKVHSEIVDSVCLNDLVPMVRGKNIFLKMDLESSEHFALQCAETFFKEANVKIIQIEWRWHRKRKESSDIIKNFLTSQKMIPLKAIDKKTKINLKDSLSWPHDVYWMHP